MIDPKFSRKHIKSRRDFTLLWLAAGFGTGFMKKAPGTWGTLPGVLLAYFLSAHPIFHIISIVLLFILGVYLCQAASRILGTHDAGCIVIDEIVGVLITFLFIPATPLALVLGFLLFRFFDIIKPPPINFLDTHIKGGLGIMVDDVVAGLFAWVILFVILSFI